MSEADTYREELRKVVSRLAVVEAERDALLNLRAGYQSLLRLAERAENPTKAAAPPRVAATAAKRAATAAAAKHTNQPKGEVSLQSTVLKIIRDAAGEPMHAREIWVRAQALGVVSDSKEPEKIVELLAYRAKKQGLPYERVGKLTWRWAGED
ncbi:MAG: hypothetical protein ACRDHD_01055 [Candidatus Limnocylindria bacterium]